MRPGPTITDLLLLAIFILLLVAMLSDDITF
jgi:hypothetical protein